MRLEADGGPGAPLPRGREPAADRLPRHRQDPPGPPDRHPPPRGRLPGQDHHEDPLLRAELRHAGGNGRPLGAEQHPERVLQCGLARRGGDHHARHRALERHRLPLHEPQRPVPAARRLPAVPRSAGQLRRRPGPQGSCQLLHDLTGGWHHELTENMRSDPGSSTCSVAPGRRGPGAAPPRGPPGGPREVPEEGRGGREPRDLARPPHQDQREGQPAPGPARNRHARVHARRPGDHQHAPNHAGLARPQAHRRRVTKGIYVHVAEANQDKITLDGGDTFTHAALLRHTRLCHAITYASCQGLTLEARVFLCDTESPHFTVKDLYVGASRATASGLLSVL